ncbi:MAG TPA: hypothetical protein ENK77_02665 [Epsilonproteobacteria bacterium]|nr:hypothetical protein [Campylobacterota bacterium]
MKKLVAAGLLVSSLAFGAEYSKAEQVITMQTLESAMGMIQKGFLRDNGVIVKMGVTSLKENLNNIHNFVIRKSVLDENFNAKAYADTEAESMNKLADAILSNFETGKKAEARVSYDKTLSRCIACHRIIRK